MTQGFQKDGRFADRVTFNGVFIPVGEGVGRALSIKKMQMLEDLGRGEQFVAWVNLTSFCQAPSELPNLAALNSYMICREK